MSGLFAVDWHGILLPSASISELVIRGSLVYLLLFFILNFLPNRQIGSVGIADLLVVILFANASQNAMSSNYTSVADCIILVLTIISWSYFLNWFGYRFRWFQNLVTPPPLLLVENGRLMYRNLRRELITEDELMIQLRKQGVEDLRKVQKAYMEPDGNISLIERDSVTGRGVRKRPFGQA
jgi:uncharacterized membrane protein YcaP (DUF421 family)